MEDKSELVSFLEEITIENPKYEIIQNMNGKLIAKWGNKIIKLSKNKIIKQEYETMKAVNEANFKYIPKIYSYFENNEYNYIIQEYIEGNTLSEIIPNLKNPTKTFEHIRKVLREIHNLKLEIYKENINDYINYITKYLPNDIILTDQEIEKIEIILRKDKISFIHGDFKSSNIILDEDENIKAVVDWEMSRYGLISDEATMWTFANLSGREFFDSIVSQESFNDQRVWTLRHYLYNIEYKDEDSDSLKNYLSKINI